MNIIDVWVNDMKSKNMCSVVVLTVVLWSLGCGELLEQSKEGQPGTPSSSLENQASGLPSDTEALGCSDHAHLEPPITIQDVRGMHGEALAEVIVSHVERVGEHGVALGEMVDAEASNVEMLEDGTMRCQLPCRFGQAEHAGHDYTMVVGDLDGHELEVGISPSYEDLELEGCEAPIAVGSEFSFDMGEALEAGELLEESLPMSTRNSRDIEERVDLPRIPPKGGETKKCTRPDTDEGLVRVLSAKGPAGKTTGRIWITSMTYRDGKRTKSINVAKAVVAPGARNVKPFGAGILCDLPCSFGSEDQGGRKYTMHVRHFERSWSGAFTSLSRRFKPSYRTVDPRTCPRVRRGYDMHLQF